MHSNENLLRNIIAAANNVFEENGFYKTNMRMIAKRANIAVGTIYNYFPGKKELFHTVLIEKWRVFQGMLMDISRNKTDDFEQRLTSLCRCFGNFILDHRRLCKELQFSPDGVKLMKEPLFRSMPDEFQKAFEIFIQLAIERHEIDAVNPSVAAVVIIGAISCYFLSFPDDNVTLDADGKVIAQIILKGLLSEGGSYDSV